MADGTYSIRLHFVEPDYTSANQRKFDIQLNGSVKQPDYDIYAAAGAQFKGVAPSFAIDTSVVARSPAGPPVMAVTGSTDELLDIEWVAAAFVVQTAARASIDLAAQ